MMKLDIEVGDEVCFLYYECLMRGTCVKVNRATYKIDVPAQSGCRPFVKNVKKTRVVHIDDKFTVVWESNVGVDGRYRIDFDTYPNQNKTFEHWLHGYNYITEV